MGGPAIFPRKYPSCRHKFYNKERLQSHEQQRQARQEHMDLYHIMPTNHIGRRKKIYQRTTEGRKQVHGLIEYAPETDKFRCAKCTQMEKQQCEGSIARHALKHAETQNNTTNQTKQTRTRNAKKID